MKAWIAATLPRSTNVIGADIATTLGAYYESRSGLIALLHRLGFECNKPEVIGRKLTRKSNKRSLKPAGSL